MSVTQNVLDLVEDVKTAAGQVKDLEVLVEQLRNQITGISKELVETRANRDKWQRKAEAVRLDPLEQENNGLKLRVGSLEKELEEKGNASTRLYKEKEEWKDLAVSRQRELVMAGEGHATSMELCMKKIERLEKHIRQLESAADNTMDQFFDGIANRMYRIAADHGFHEGDEHYVGKAQLVAARVGEWVSNLHGEVSEFWEAYRKDVWDMPCDKKINGVPIGLTCFEEELADTAIRCMDVSVALGIRLGRAIRIKSEYNKTRPYKHGGKLA